MLCIEPRKCFKSYTYNVQRWNGNTLTIIFWTINSKKIEKILKNFTKTIAKLKKLYYNLHEVEKSGTKW